MNEINSIWSDLPARDLRAFYFFLLGLYFYSLLADKKKSKENLPVISQDTPYN
jgi:hypothetical protein